MRYSDFRGWVFDSGSVTIQAFDEHHVAGQLVLHGEETDGAGPPVTVTGSFNLPRS
jgi:hypothetical protein